MYYIVYILCESMRISMNADISNDKDYINVNSLKCLYSNNIQRLNTFVEFKLIEDKSLNCVSVFGS